MKEDDHEDEGKVAASLREIDEIFSCLENLGKRIVYIPGNHDPVLMFKGGDIDTWRRKRRRGEVSAHGVDHEMEEDGETSSLCENVHKKVVCISPNLSLLCYGGAHPATLDGKEKWRGFPFTSEGDLSLDFESFIHTAFPTVPLDHDLILFTHVGPANVNTSTDNRDVDKSSILTGSGAMEKLVRKHNDRILLQVHGHSHHGRLAMLHFMSTDSYVYIDHYLYPPTWSLSLLPLSM